MTKKFRLQHVKAIQMYYLKHFFVSDVNHSEDKGQNNKLDDKQIEINTFIRKTETGLT
jgi:hypothetical protein